MSDTTTSYATNRETLKRIAEKLRKETDINIDELIPLIDEASTAYKICRDRVESVEKLLKERLPQEAVESGR